MNKSPKREYYDQQAKRFELDFKNHKATLLVDQPQRLYDVRNGIQVINWQAPGTWIYGCRFIIHSSWLTVLGDMGEAVYQWSEPITPQFLKGLDFDYFMGKCQASPHGKQFMTFDSRVAFQNLSDFRAEQETEPAFDPNQQSEFLAVLDGLEMSSSKDEYFIAATEVYDDTGDSEMASQIMEFGLVPDCQAIGHFIGLKMALTQLFPA